MKNNGYKIIQQDCSSWLSKYEGEPFALSFVDPPFNQGKDYKYFDDKQSDREYWGWIHRVLSEIHRNTLDGGCIYFMQREKNTELVLTTLRDVGWEFQNLIIWKKKTSAVPSSSRFGKHFQIIAFATKGKKTRVFNKLRITPPLPANYKYEREKGIFVADVWEDIRELTSGYFAGDEAIRGNDGSRFHKQQAPLTLLLRIILSSTNVGDLVLYPFAGTGTTLVTSSQLNRKSIGIEIDPENTKCIENRLCSQREADDIQKYYNDYIYTENLEQYWGGTLVKTSNGKTIKKKNRQEHYSLFED